MGILQILLEGLILAFALSLDTLVTGFAYGAEGIKIPFKSALLINTLCAIFLMISIFAGKLLIPYISANIATYISFSVLLTIGLFKIINRLFKKLFKKLCDRQISINLADYSLVIKVYKDVKEADENKDKILSLKESLSLSIALSFDSLATGFSAGLGGISGYSSIILVFLIGVLVMHLGCRMGKILNKKLKLDLNWLSGSLLIILAISKII